MDFSLPLADGTTISFRAPTLLDIRSVNKDMAADGGVPTEPGDPRNADFTYRLLHRCARWPSERGERPSLEGFLDLIPVAALAGRGEEMGAFFGGRPTSPSSSTPSSGSA